MSSGRWAHTVFTTRTNGRAANTRRPQMTRFIAACALVGALFGAVFGLVAASAAAANPAPQTAPGDLLDPRTYAPESRPFLAVYAVGVQKYACQPNGAWLFTDPEATLYDATQAGKPIC